MTNEYKELTKIMLLVLCATAVICAVVLIIANSYASYVCESHGRITGQSVYYNNFDSCYIDGVRYEEYINRTIAADAVNKIKGE